MDCRYHENLNIKKTLNYHQKNGVTVPRLETIGEQMGQPQQEVGAAISFLSRFKKIPNPLQPVPNDYFCFMFLK